jgi:hypothetical protein
MGAICSYCKGDMRAADGCVKVPVENDKGRFDPILYGNETRYGLEKSQNPEECHDCAAKLDNYHHRGCDWEQRPSCGGQLIGCDCGNSWYDPLPPQ